MFYIVNVSDWGLKGVKSWSSGRQSDLIQIYFTRF